MSFGFNKRSFRTALVRFVGQSHRPSRGALLKFVKEKFKQGSNAAITDRLLMDHVFAIIPRLWDQISMTESTDPPLRSTATRGSDQMSPNTSISIGFAGWGWPKQQSPRLGPQIHAILLFGTSHEFARTRTNLNVSFFFLLNPNEGDRLSASTDLVAI